MKKINKSVLITYIISCIFLGLYILFYSLSFSLNYNLLGGFVYFVLSIVPFLFYCLSFVVSLILGIINFVKTKERTVKRNLIIMFIVLLLVGIAGQFIPKKINENIQKNYNDQVVKTLDSLINKIKNNNTNKYVYFIDDLKELDNSIDYSKYDDTSYITYFNNEIYVCMSNSNYKISGKENNFKESQIDVANKKCNYKFTFEEAEEYSKNYFENKYKDIIIKKIEVIDNCEYDYLIPFCPEYKEIKIGTNYGDIIIKIEIVNGKIVIQDNGEEIFSNLSSDNMLLSKIKDYTLKYLNVSEIDISTNIYSINYLESNNDVIVVGSKYEYVQAKEYAQSLGNYLVNENQDAKIMIRKFIRNNSGEIEHQNVIYVKVNNGNLTIE